MENTNSLGSRLKNFRKQLKLTQIGLANTLGVTKWTILDYEANKRQPSKTFLFALKDLYNLNINWLLTGEGEMFYPDDFENNKNLTAGMNSEFIKKLQEDLKDKDDSFYASLSISKEKLFDITLGRKRLTRIEVIELARKLNRSLNEYIALAGYMPEEFKKIVGNEKAWGLLRSMSQLTDAEISQVMDSLANTIRQHFKNKEKNKKNS